MSIAIKLNYLNVTKESIKDAIIAKGVEVSDNDTFRSYASKIADISSGGWVKSGIRHFFDGTNTLYNIPVKSGISNFFDGTNTLYNIPVLTGIITEEE